MVVLIMGPPGVGKGTQAQRISEQFHLSHLSTGDILRNEVGKQTPLGTAAQHHMNAGTLVPDDIIIDMMRRAIADRAGNALLDGFPRTLDQARALAAAQIPIAAVIDLDAADATIIERLAGRLFHPASGRTYHRQFSPPKIAGQDDLTGDPLIQREDDKADTVRARLAVYRRQTAPLKHHYAQAAQGGGAPVINADGEAPIDQVAADIAAHLGPLLGR